MLPLRCAEKEQTEILDAAEALEKETEQFDAEKQRMISEHQQERAKLEENVVWLRQENESQCIVSHSV